MIQTYRGIRFVQMEVNDDDEEDRLRFGMDELDTWVRCDDRTSMNMMCPVVMATSPDWDRTESEDDGLRFYDFSHEYLAEVDEIDLDWHDGTENHGRHAAATGTPESFMVDEEPWVDDHTADDDGLHFWMFNERGDSTPGYTHGGWTIDYKEGIKDCIREYDGVCYTWLPEDFEPAPEPELCSPPTPEAAPPTGWGDRPDEFAWTVGLVLTYKTFTARLDMTVERPGDFTEAVKALVSTVKDIYKGVSLW